MPEVLKIPRVGLRIVGPTTDDRYLKTSATNHVLAELTPAQVLADIGANPLGADLDLNEFGFTSPIDVELTLTSASLRTFSVLNEDAGGARIRVFDGSSESTMTGDAIVSGATIEATTSLLVGTTSVLNGNVNVTGAVGVNANSATALLVEQDGVFDEVFCVDTAEPNILMKADIDIVLRNMENITIDGRADPRQESLGSVRFLHTPAIVDTRCITMSVDSNSQADTMGLAVEYTATGLSAGKEGIGVEVSIDTANATGGHVDAFVVTEVGLGTLTINALHVAIGISPLIHESGSFINVESALTTSDEASFANVTAAFNSTGTDVELFSADNDYVYIGMAAKFSEIEVLLNTVASGPGIRPEFYFSTGAGTWAQFGPNDVTNGFRLNGAIEWDSTDLSGWVVATYDGEVDKFWIKIKRTQNALTTPPVEDFIQVAEPVEFSWNKDGDISCNDLTLGTGSAADRSLTFSGSANSGILLWDESAGNLQFDGNILLDTDKRMMFRATGNYIGSADADRIDVVVGTTLNLGNATTTVNLGTSATTVNIAHVSTTLCRVGTAATTTRVGKGGGNALLSDTGGTQRYFMGEVDDEWNLGDATHEFRDGYFDGTLQTDVLRIDDGGKASAASATPTLLMASGGNTRDNAVWIPINLNGTAYWVPGWTDPAT